MNIDYNNIGETETFNPENYPKIEMELDELLERFCDISGYYKREIIIPYLKKNSVKKELIDAFPAISALLLSGNFKTANLEALFASCRWNKAFRSSLERYIKGRLN